MSSPTKELTKIEMTLEKNDPTDKNTNPNFFRSQKKVFKSTLRELMTFHPREWIGAFRFNSSYSLFCKGDIDGFMALFINNLATLLAIIMSLKPILGNDIVYGKIVPGIGLSMLWGNLYYVYMARKLAFKEKRGDICTMPYGINTPGAFAFIYVIILPTYYGCITTHENGYCQELAWQVGLASNFIAGIILLVLCVFGEFIRRNTPSVALLSSISGLGFVYLALNEHLSVTEVPLVAFVPLAIVMLGYLGGVKYGPFPVAFLALVTGTSVAWITGLNTVPAVYEGMSLVKAYRPVFPLKEMFQQLHTISSYLSTTIPTALSIAIGTIQCVESAKRAGDFYPTREVMFADGVGTLIASLFGSVFGMTTFIGHPAFKKMGAKQAYSLMNGFAYVVLCFFGVNALILSIIAVVSINPIVIFIGLIICADTLSITPQRHYPAFLLGIMSIVADWAHETIIKGVAVAYSSYTAPGVQFKPNITSSIHSFSYQGLVNFGGGSQLQCIFIAAIMMYMIDRKFLRAAFWSSLAAPFALFGLINSSTVGILVKPGDSGWRFSLAYVFLSILFLLLEIGQRMKWVKSPETEPDDLSSIEWAEWKRQQLLEEETPKSTDAEQMTA